VHDPPQLLRRRLQPGAVLLEHVAGLVPLGTECGDAGN
jgi:hypothetical protein